MSAEPIPGPKPDTDEWHALRTYDETRDRKVIFGASEAAAICGRSPYQQPLDVYLVKRGLKEPPDESEAMAFGKFMESGVLKMYEHSTGRKLKTKLPMYFHPEHEWLSATPDALTRENFPQADLVDAKTSTIYMVDEEGHDTEKWGREGTDQVPTTAAFQAQHQMAVMGLSKCYFPLLIGRRLRIYEVKRHDVLIGAIVASTREMYERLVNEDPPEPNWEHPQTAELLSVLHGHDMDEVVMLTDEQAGWWFDAQLHATAAAEHETKRRANLNKLLAAMGAAGRANIPACTQDLKRIVVETSHYGLSDVVDVARKVEKQAVKREGYQYLRAVKAK